MFPYLHLQQNALYFFISLKKYWRKTNEIRICSNSKQQTANSKQQTANSKQQTATKLISITALLAFSLIGCTTKKSNNSKNLAALLLLSQSVQAPTCTTSNYIADPVTSSTATAIKFSYISSFGAWLGYFSITGLTGNYWLITGPSGTTSRSYSLSNYQTDKGCSGTSASSGIVSSIAANQTSNVPAAFPISTSTMTNNQVYIGPSSSTSSTYLIRMFISDSTASASVSNGYTIQKAY